MNTYRVIAQPHIRHALVRSGFTSPTGEAISDLIADVAVREISQAESGAWIFDLHLQRPTHEDALNEIVIALQQLGFAYVRATVSEWADAAVECAVVGGLGTGGAGATTTRDPVVTILAGALGMLVGGWAGSQMKRLQTVYEVRPAYPSGWVLTPVSDEAVSPASLRPGLSPS